MAAPLHQRVIRLVVVAFTGVLLLGSLADAIANALDLFTTSRAIAGSAILILAAAVGQTYLHFRGLAWQRGGQRVILRRLGPAPLAGLAWISTALY